MKNYFKIIFVLILATLTFSCNNEEPNGITKNPSPVKFKINFMNNSDLSVDVTLKRVSIGDNVLENTSDIFKSADEYHNYINYSTKEDFIEYEYNYVPKPNVKLEMDNTGDIIHDILYTDDFQSVLLRLTFGNKDERILAGWPKYYYSKLKNVVLYGFNYDSDNYDKKIWDYRINENNDYLCYSIDSDDNTGNVKGYSSGTIYSIKVTINSPDDIKMEVLPETGSKFE